MESFAAAALLRLGAHMLALYRADKQRRSLMDYDDLIQAARQLLERPGSAAWVLFKLDGGIDHLLIDEAQDTNPEQWAIVRALTAEFFAGSGRHEDRADSPRTVFAVGDRKQSIYGFQGAAPDAVRPSMRARFASAPGPPTEWALHRRSLFPSARRRRCSMRSMRCSRRPAARDGVASATNSSRTCRRAGVTAGWWRSGRPWNRPRWTIRRAGSRRWSAPSGDSPPHPPRRADRQAHRAT